jgi:carbonic anhydrase
MTAPDVDRRTFLTTTLLAGAGFALGGGAALAAAPAAPAMSPEQAMQKLMDGNARYVAGKSTCYQYPSARAALVRAQNPFAIILSCSDSRVPPEAIFDQNLGQLFVIRVAGNFADDDGIASMEYAVSHFASPLLLVMGHSGCGAVHATVDALRDHGHAPGKIGEIIKAITPAAEVGMKQPGDPYANTVAENVRQNVRSLAGQAPILSKAVAESSLRVVGGVYDLKTGKVSRV